MSNSVDFSILERFLFYAKSDYEWKILLLVHIWYLVSLTKRKLKSNLIDHCLIASKIKFWREK